MAYTRKGEAVERSVSRRKRCLRLTAASGLRMSGADIHTVAQLLGHKDLRMAARYQHLSPAFLADAVKRLDSVFGDPCSCSRPTRKFGADRHHSVTRTLGVIEGWAAKSFGLFGVPKGIRTPVIAVKGRCPRPG